MARPVTDDLGRRRRAHLALVAVVSACALAATVLYRFPPTQYGFYPQCPIRQFTGWDCPGCGMTRALAALLHGQVVEAMRWNPLVLVFLAGLLAWGVTAYRRQLSGEAIAWPRVPNSVVTGVLVLVGVSTVVRNLAW